MDSRRTLSALLFLVCLGLEAGSASAHRVEFPKRDILTIERNRITLTLEYIVGNSAESVLLRRLFDHDHSGELDARERKELLAFLGQQATAFLRFELDGQPLPLQKERALLGPGVNLPDGSGNGSESTEPLSVVLTLVAAEELLPGTHTLRIADRHKDRRVAVPLRLLLRGPRLLSSLPPLPLLSEGHPLELQLTVQAQPPSSP